MNELIETIAAIATPAGAGGIGIVRVSGEDAFHVADKVFRANSGERAGQLGGYTARLGKVYDSHGALLDEAIMLVFHAPRSYTGEDVVELMCHGGDVVCRALLQAVLDAGAVMASRGEFTRRAYVNGRIDLARAEAVCDVINSVSAQGEKAAAALAGGALAKRIESVEQKIIDVQAHITAYIDYPEEDVDEVDIPLLRRTLGEVCGELSALEQSYNIGSELTRGVPAVIVGSPNVGKSTLLNLIAGAPKALVTPIAGTTRDVVEQRVKLGGTVLLLADTAGIRESDDLVESMGVDLALERLESASLVLAVFDSSRELSADDLALIERLHGRRVVAVVNKTDLSSRMAKEKIESAFENVVYISANDPSSLAALDSALARALKTDVFDPDAVLLASARQRDCVARALGAARSAALASEQTTLDVVYALLSETLEDLDELFGQNVGETVLDEVFSRFCVGK